MSTLLPDIASILPQLDALVALPISWVEGGRDPATGMDCYGLIIYAYALGGIALPNDPQAVYAYFQQASPPAQPWDVLALAPREGDPRPHVALCVNAGEAYHCGRTTNGVARVNLRARFWSHHARLFWRYACD